MLEELLPPLLRGAVLTLELTVGAAVVALLVALLVGLARLSSNRPVRLVATFYVELFRGSSLLVQIFYFFFVLPLVGIRLPPFATGIIALGLNVGAYGSEVVRAAITNVDPGQREAATALNMSPALAMRRIILPQAFVAMLPPFGNLLVELLKATSLVSLITLTELSFAGRQLLQQQGHALEIYALVLVIYFLLAYPLTRLVRMAERRLAARVGVGVGG
jgi:polar amino acid transport system permease protein